MDIVKYCMALLLMMCVLLSSYEGLRMLFNVLSVLLFAFLLGGNEGNELQQNRMWLPAIELQGSNSSAAWLVQQF